MPLNRLIWYLFRSRYTYGFSWGWERGQSTVNVQMSPNTLARWLFRRSDFSCLLYYTFSLVWSLPISLSRGRRLWLCNGRVKLAVKDNSIKRIASFSLWGVDQHLQYTQPSFPGLSQQKSNYNSNRHSFLLLVQEISCMNLYVSHADSAREEEIVKKRIIDWKFHGQKKKAFLDAICPCYRDWHSYTFVQKMY